MKRLTERAKELGETGVQNGLNMREMLAAQAMQGAWFKLTDNGNPNHFEHAAGACVNMADAMLEALVYEGE